MSVNAFSANGTKPGDVLVWVAIASCSITILTCAWKCFKRMCCFRDSEREPLLQNRVIVEINREQPTSPINLEAETPRVSNDEALNRETQPQTIQQELAARYFQEHWKRKENVNTKTPEDSLKFAEDIHPAYPEY